MTPTHIKPSEVSQSEVEARAARVRQEQAAAHVGVEAPSNEAILGGNKYGCVEPRIVPDGKAAR
jgi:hypothetical protein